MATSGKVASRYAKALFDLLKGTPGADSVLAELEQFSSLEKTHQELGLLIASPGFSLEDKTQVALDVASKMGLSKPAVQILNAVSRMGRLAQLAPIVERLRVLLRENEGVQPILVWTAQPVTEGDKKSIEGKFEKVLGKKVEATYRSRPGLVGGLKVVAGSRTFDGSVSGWLDSLQERLVEGEV